MFGMVDELREEEIIETKETPEVIETAENAVTAAEAAPEAPAAAEETMEEIMQQYDVVGNFHKNSVVEGKVISAREDGWLVDVGYKSEGFLPKSEWTHRVLIEETPEPEVGSVIKVQITSMGTPEDSQLGLSRWRCEFDSRWKAIEEEAEKNETVTVKGLRKVKGGLIVNCHGIEGFIPISHLSQEGRSIGPAKLVDQEFPARLIEKDRRKRRLVFTRRTLLDEEIAAQRQAFYDQVHEGDVLEGTVSSITSFGIFVNLGAMEGLVHISELSWQRANKAKDFAAKGDTVKVKVIGIDKENNRISLSIRQTLEDPWTTAGERWSVGKETEGVVTNLTDFGAFVEIEPGIEGLIRIGDLSWKRISNPRDVLKKGQKVKVSIIEADMDRKRIGLGYKQLNDPWKDAETKYPKDSEISVKVVRIVDFGVFVEIEEGLEGLIHISQLSQQRVEKPRDVVAEGDVVTARVVEVDPVQRRIRLSMRPPRDNSQRREQRDEQQPREQQNREPRERRFAQGDAPAREDRPRRRPDRLDRRKQDSSSQYPQEEMNFTIGDFFKQHESEEA